MVVFLRKGGHTLNVQRQPPSAVFAALYRVTTAIARSRSVLLLDRSNTSMAPYTLLQCPRYPDNNQWYTLFPLGAQSLWICLPLVSRCRFRFITSFSFQRASDHCSTAGTPRAMATPTVHCTEQTFRRAGLREAEFNPLPCRSALVKPTLLAQKENNKQNRGERKTRVKVSERPALRRKYRNIYFLEQELLSAGMFTLLFIRTETESEKLHLSSSIGHMHRAPHLDLSIVSVYNQNTVGRFLYNIMLCLRVRVLGFLRRRKRQPVSV